jgi:uncharacterized protein YdhG (YjbR/CyaY superfamily)
MTPTKPAPKTSTANREKSAAFSADEKAAMKELLAERKREGRMNKDREVGERALLDVLAKMPQPDRGIAERLHAMVTVTAPALMPKTWYGMPAWARDGKVICFFKNAGKFKERYHTFGFDTAANLDGGSMWVTSFALTELTATDEKKLAALVKKAARP